MQQILIGCLGGRREGRRGGPRRATDEARRVQRGATGPVPLVQRY